MTFLCHSITVTSGMTDCSQDRLEEFKLENIYSGEIFCRKNVCWKNHLNYNPQKFCAIR